MCYIVLLWLLCFWGSVCLSPTGPLYLWYYFIGPWCVNWICCKLRCLLRSSEHVVFEVLYCGKVVPCGVFRSAGGERPVTGYNNQKWTTKKNYVINISAPMILKTGRWQYNKGESEREGQTASPASRKSAYLQVKTYLWYHNRMLE